MVELDFILDVVKKSGQIIKKNFKGSILITHKGETDLVTNVDKEVDALIRDEIKKYFPQYGILSEEGGTLQGSSNKVFVVDPLDGTTNFVKGYPNVCISIALMEEKEVILGVIYNPISEDIYYAVKGGGSFKNGKLISVSKTENLSNSLLATGFPYDFSEYSNFPQFEALFRKTLSVRVDGSAALDLARVAEGVIDGYWEKGLSKWDIAAGSLIVMEANGVVSDFRNGGNYLEKGEIIAANPFLHPQILEVLNAL
ncbi:inositol monophosphatase family protein [Caldisericum exile]|uniref:Inositol-1-monophosphatase n=1 Tax=Caldisericum exile (strain DSM 21853 / NBRC 104410 / AZM16c01) TaxID=511051 RepID=A0A7U6JGH7_CALEA|nr:inositol monophosphatase family protein [Caldisericum exile]BAL81500.1 inositol-1-monophosphatase [Caldisericum exile AZM16c01]